MLHGDFTLVPILCGSPRSVLPAQSRSAFLDYAGPFLDALREIAAEPADGDRITVGMRTITVPD